MVGVLLQEYHELVATFKRQEALLYQFSEEKVQLAQHALELITQYQKQLDEVGSPPVAYLAKEMYRQQCLQHSNTSIRIGISMRSKRCAASASRIGRTS